MNVQIDIKGTIDYAPEFFAWLTGTLRKSGHKVFIVSGEPDVGNSKTQVAKFLKKRKIAYDALLLTPPDTIDSRKLPRGFNPAYRLFAHKLISATENRIDVLFDDDADVARLIHKHLPRVKLFRPMSEFLHG